MLLSRIRLGIKLPSRSVSITRPHHRVLSTSVRLAKMSDTEKKPKKGSENGSNGEQPHQYQAGTSTDRKEDQWKHRAPYRVHDKAEDFPVKWKGQCHCGTVKYELSRDKPLASKYCHCTTCQRMHGVSYHYIAFWSQLWTSPANRTHLGPVPMGGHLPQRRYQLHQRRPRSRLV
jgi:hypothetical protein